MATKVLMEALSPTMEEGRIASWLKREGDAVDTGDALAEVETDKAVMELQARGKGILRKILVPEGGTTEVGNLVAVIAAKDEDIASLVGQAGAAAGSATPPTAAGAAAEGAAAAATPAVAQDSGERIKASPLARRLARDRGISLAEVAGSGPGGRIVKRDLETVTPAVSAAPAAPIPGGHEDIPLSQMRKTIARRLVQSLGPVPHFFLTAEIDMERAAEAREELNALGDVRISINDIVMKVTAQALRQHPGCNAWWQDGHVRVFHEVHLGMAVAIEDGLITPVIRNAHAKSLREIATEARTLATRARDRALQPDEYTGGTFSLSNLGMLGIDQFTAVINPPEAGILAVGAVVPKPVVHDGAVVIRRRMRVTMSCDHRVIDGATGATFLQTVARMLENPLALVW